MRSSVTAHLDSIQQEFIELAELVVFLKSEMAENDVVMAAVDEEQVVVHRLMA